MLPPPPAAIQRTNRDTCQDHAYNLPRHASLLAIALVINELYGIIYLSHFLNTPAFPMGSSPYFSYVSRSNINVASCSRNGNEPCIALSGKTIGMNEFCIFHRECEPRAPPPTLMTPASPELVPLASPEDKENCPSRSCIMLYVDRQIEKQISAIPCRDPSRPSAPRPVQPAVRTKTLSLDESARKTTQLRQISSIDDDDATTIHVSNPPSSRSSDAEDLLDEVPTKRRAFFQMRTVNAQKRRKGSISLQPALPTSPTSSMVNVRSTIHPIPTTPFRLGSPSQSSGVSQHRPSISGRQISSPVMSTSSASPAIDRSHPASTSSKMHSWPGSYCPSRASPRPPKEEPQSYWSDSSDDENKREGSSSNALLATFPGRRRQFRRRLSETFDTLFCRS